MDIVALKNKHLSRWVRELRERKPDDVDNIGQLPDVMFYEISIDAALAAGWFGPDVTQEQVDELTYAEAQALSGVIWEAHGKARGVDPN